MSDKSKFTAEAERLSRKAEEATRPSEKRMLETQSRFYEALAADPDSTPESEAPRSQDAG